MQTTWKYRTEMTARQYDVMQNQMNRDRAK